MWSDFIGWGIAAFVWSGVLLIIVSIILLIREAYLK